VPEDSALAGALLAGEPSALTTLMDRYDRLVRYTIFHFSRPHCLADPDWLDTVASDTWMGLIATLHRDQDSIPDSFKPYLVRIARNKTISALRRAGKKTVVIEGEPPTTLACDDPSVEETLTRFEYLQALRQCTAQLNENEQTILTQLDAIMDRHWTQAGQALGIAESTLRSRWQQIKAKLKTCLESKM